MKNFFITCVLAFSLCGCANEVAPVPNKIVGTWELIYAETIENDSLEIKDLSNTRFIKIINNSHFSFFNQDKNSSEEFYGGAGTYSLINNNYIETLHFTPTDALRNHRFPFRVEFKGDTLIQSGLEEVEAAGLKRNIVEKYIRFK